jgi:antitoxin ParD1/3/4
MNIPLNSELEQFISDKVKRDRIQEQRLAELKAKIRFGIEELERGEGIDGEEVFADIEEDVQRAEAKQ